ncbi:RNA polymerase sigma factor [Devosia sp.]|uniref:RNA polymerase sigma factor n=1 Tax=Devosia sp. TaxID=1871048 RepID=UPI003A90DBA8
MRSTLHTQLLAIARRTVGVHHAEDVVQDAMLVAVESGRLNLTDPANTRWLKGVVRNRARMAARTAHRSLRRDSGWHTDPQPPGQSSSTRLPEILTDLPPALRTLAALVLTGHNRREIAWLLDLPDTALRQRILALKRRLAARGLAAPSELTGLNLDLAYGRIRAALQAALDLRAGQFATHDPDGHLFVVHSSRSAPRRQLIDATERKGLP